MSEELRKSVEVRLEDLVRFTLQPSQEYQGDRLEELMNSIERLGLMTPIIVRPVDGEKYEIICGHNRANAMRRLGRNTILADVRDGLSDDKALELFYDSNLNQQSFSDWNYSQKIKAIQYTERLIRENSQQGKRSDLTGEATEEGTSVQGRHKSEGKSRRSTTRDRMARRLGISTATLSKYRSIVRLSDELIESIARRLDEKIITFEVASIMSGLSPIDIKMIIREADRLPDKKIDPARLKAFKKRGTAPGTSPVFSKELVKELFVPRNPSKESVPLSAATD